VATKIYTKTGDKGSTGLLGGERVLKSHPVLEACGALDELNAWLGLIGTNALPPIAPSFIQKTQGLLFNIGAVLASPETSAFKALEISDEDVREIENAIDSMEATLPELKNFVLPGGNVQAAYCHLARTVCRRAERHIVSLGGAQKIEHILQYINRLSDLLFVAARKAIYDAGDKELPWKP